MSGVFHGSEHTNENPPPPFPAWEGNSAFGVVHPHGCKTCRKYMSHFVAASRTPEDHSFHSAVNVRDSLATMRYLEGIREGRRIQKQSDDSHLYRYCHQQCDEALALSVQREDEIQVLKEELAELRGLLFSLQQVMFEDMPRSESSDSGSLDALDLQDSIYFWTESAARYSDSGLDLPPTICAVGQEEEGEAEMEEENNEQEIDGVRDLSVDDTPVFSSTPQPQSDASDSETDSSSSSMSSPSSAESLLSDSEPETPLPQIAAELEEGPDELEHLKSLIVAAHDPNNPSILKEVKALCSEAHLAPRRERTACQLYLLKHWRSPSPTRRAHLAPPPIPEIFVDASHSGIGFIFGRQWLAWQLKDGWRSETRDINWAEMVAVELGIRAMISAGHHSSVLRVWSDNDGVVRALNKRTCKKLELKHILDMIFRLCDAYDIQLAVDWVWTKNNPADGPSRGVYPSKDLRFEHHPPIPKNLFPFVSAVL